MSKFLKMTAAGDVTITEEVQAEALAAAEAQRREETEISPHEKKADFEVTEAVHHVKADSIANEQVHPEEKADLHLTVLRDQILRGAKAVRKGHHDVQKVSAMHQGQSVQEKAKIF